MDRKEDAILADIALATVGIGVLTTSKPLGVFFAESTRQFPTTTAATAFFLFLCWLHRSEPTEDEGGHSEHAHAAD